MDGFEKGRFAGLVITDDDVDAFIEIDLEPVSEALEVLDFDLLDIHRSPHFPAKQP